MWGQVYDCCRYCAVNRIIPTRVGTSKVPPLICLGSKDHPHACGDKLSPLCSSVAGFGSSPRVWGQALMVKALEYDVRIIPTRVGTSFLICAIDGKRRDHPHACGDKNRRRPCSRAFAGSSPRVWGQERFGRMRGVDLGIIPTRVGTRIR